MYKSLNNSNLSSLLIKTASTLLAVILFLSPLGNISFASTSESSPWVYDVARVTSGSEPNSQFGDYRQVYQINLPSGVSDHAPNLQLNYSSQSVGYGSTVGYGWSLNIPSVMRPNKNGIDQMYSRSDFSSSLDGELSGVEINEYIPKVQTSVFKKYTKNTDDWTAFSPEGVEYTFGSSTNARQKSHSTSTEIYAWYLDEIKDKNNNKIVYEYIQEAGKVYLSNIRYGYHSTGDYVYEVQFVYASTSAEYVSYNTGFEVVNDRVLTSIEVYFDSSLISKYELGYTNPSGSTINLLNSIHHVAYDENGISASTSPQYFEYIQEDIGWTNDVSIATTTPSQLYTTVSNTGQNYSEYSRDQLVDINGDGLTDWIEGDDVYLNNGEGWESSPSWTLPVSEFHHKNRLVDVNGDLLPDIVTADDVIFDSQFNGQNPNVYTRSIQINQGDGTWVEDSNWANTIPTILYQMFWIYPTGHQANDYNVFIVDMNGDGLNDWIYDGYVYLNNGSGWSTTTNWARLQSGSDSFDTKWRMSDINNDGLPDLIKSDTVIYDPQHSGYTDTYTDEVWMNMGNGEWRQNSTWESTIPTDFGSRFYIQYWNYPGGITYYKNRVYLLDVNGDGLDDWLYSNKALLNTGQGWATTTITLPVSVGELIRSYRLVDIDGDLLLDFVKDHYSYFFGTVTRTKEARINDSKKQWLLSTSTNEYGGITTITYDVTTAQREGQLLNPDSPIVSYVVSEIIQDSLFGSEVTTNYIYEGGKLYFSSTTPFDREYAGFGIITKITDIGSEVTYYHQGDEASTTTGENVDDKSLIGKVFKVEIKDLSDNLYKLIRYNFATSSLGASSTFVKLESTVTLDFDGDGDEKASATSYTYSDSHGSVLTQTEWGEVAGETDGTFSDVGVDDRETLYEYATSTSGLVIPSKQTLEDDSGNKVAESRFYYDNQSLGSVTTGNLTKQENWVNDSTYIDTEWTYDSYGNVLSETDANNNTTNFEYDAYNLFVASTTNAESHNTQYEYDYASGEVATTTDSNGEIFVTLHDGFKRPLKEYAPDPQSGSQVLVSEYVYTDIAGAISIQKTNHLSGSLSHNSYTYFDGFGQVVQERIEAEDSNEYAVKDYIYGDNNLLEKESLPYFSTSTTLTTATNNDDLYSTYGYDALGRISSVHTVVGTTTTSYDQWKETVTDTAGNEKEFTYDAFGRLEQVTENEDINSYDTDYDWDDLNNLIKITDAEDNVRNISYDGLSRRTELEDLHNPTDASFGTWDFTYDGVGNVTSMTDPNSQTVNYTYDYINRMLTEDYTGQSGTEVTYSYDSCTNGVGYLCIVGNSSATTSYAYTPNGLVESESKLIAGTTYTTSYEYDRLGNQTLIVYPDNSEVQYTYHKGNKVNQIEQKESGGSFVDVIENVTYGPHGQIEYLKHGNGSETTRTYDASELYRISSILTTATSSFGTGGPGAELTEIEAGLAEFPVLEEEVVFELVEEEIIETDHIGTSTELEIIETASTTTEESETIATSTEEAQKAVFEVASSSEEVELPETLTASTSETTKAVADEVIDEFKKVKAPKQKLDTAHHIKNVHDAKVWRKYHKERLAGIAEELGTDSSAYKKAEEAAEEFELQLYDEKYTVELDGEITGTELEWVREKSKKGLEALVSFLLPEKLYAYVFGTEDFESCSSLPCNASYAPTWGGGALSLDNSGQVEGDDSLEQSFSSQGGAWLEYTSMAEDEVYVQFKVYLPSSMSWGASGYYNVLRLEDSNNNEIFSAKIEDWGSARLTLIGDVFPWTNTNIDLTTGAVNTIEVRFKKGTSGAVDVWLDNATEGSPDYATSSANTGTDDVNDIQVGVTYAPESISTTYTDEITIDTAFIGSLSGGGGTSTPPTTVPFVEIVQDLSYEYDSVGNIIEIIDNSGTDSAATTTYTYDDLYRLTSASTSQASTSPYTRTYTYSSIGNILTKSDIGTYTYGTSGGGGLSTSTETIYDDSLASAWDNWSWGGTYNLSSTDQVESGTYSIEATYTSQYGGLQLRNGSVDTSNYEDLEFNVYIESGSGINLQVKSYNKATNAQLGQVSLSNYLPSGTYTTGVWRNVSIPLSAIGFDNFSGNGSIVIQSDGSPTVVAHFDNIELVGESSGGGGGSTTGHPHAASSINGISQTYDDNGNLTATGDGSSYTWNYRNELIESVSSNGTTTHKYDYDGQRVSKTHGTSTTVYPFGHYEVKDGEVNKHIYLGDILVATIQDDTPAPKTYYNHLDHLGSTNAVTGSDGYLNQSLAYYPFGDMRVDNTYDSINQNNRFTGHDYDSQTDLSYMGARYYNGQTGRFTSQDPVAFTLGNSEEMQENIAVPLAEYLRNPQRLNTYAYAGNNPIKNVDRNGKDYYEVNASVSANPYSGNFGLKIDIENARMDFTYGGGFTAGASADLSLMYNPNDLPEGRSYITEEVEGVAGLGLIGKGSLGIQVGSPNPGDIEATGGMSYGIGAGAGLSTGVTANHSFTVFDYSKKYNILKAALTKFAENLRTISEFNKAQREKEQDQQKKSDSRSDE